LIDLPIERQLGCTFSGVQSSAVYDYPETDAKIEPVSGAEERVTRHRGGLPTRILGHNRLRQFCRGFCRNCFAFRLR